MVPTKPLLASLLALQCNLALGDVSPAHGVPRALIPPKKGERFAKNVALGRRPTASTSDTRDDVVTASPPISSPRGGDLGTLASSSALARTFCALAGLDAVTFSLVPRRLLALVGRTDVEEGSAVDCVLRDVGAHAASAAVAAYLSIFSGSSVEKSLGCAYLPRLAFSASNLLTGAKGSGGATMTTTTTTTTALACASLCLVVFALLGDEWKPLWFAKGASLVFLAQGLTQRLNPVSSSQKEYADFGYEEDDLTAATISFAADYQIMCHALLLLLAEGFDPIKVVGYTSLGSVALLVDFAYGFKMHKVLRFNVAWVLIAAIFCGALGFGTLN